MNTKKIVSVRDVKFLNVEHCGLCPLFPCTLLKMFSYDKEHGDRGKRIKILQNLKEKVQG